jgi:polyhydroxybutyrate depolymerase
VATGLQTGQTLDVGGNTRTYDIFVPPTYDPNKPIPIVVMLHGDIAVSLRPYVPMEQATNGKAIVVYPYGAGGGGWDLSAPQNNYDYPFMEALRASLESNYCADKKRVFSYGVSNGAFFANMVACWRGTKIFNGIAAQSGGLYAPEGVEAVYDDQGRFICPSGPVPAIILHGTSDAVVSYQDGLGARDTWLAANSCSSSPTTPFDPSPCEKYSCENGPVVMCSIAMGHNLWQPSATAVWNFFSAL